MAVTAGDARGSPVRVHAAATPDPLPRQRGEFRSTITMSILRMSGKTLGMLKTLVIAAMFGTSAALDAFWIAYTMPLVLPGMIRGVVATAFIPGFMRSSLKGTREIDWRGLNTLFTIVTITIAILSILVAVFRDGLVSFMAPGLAPPTHALAADLTGLMSLAVFCFGINAILSAVLQALNRFIVMSLESVVTNVVIIAGCVFLAQRYGVYGLTIAVIAGFAVHTLMLAFANRDLLARNIRPTLDFGHADFRDPARHMFPLLVGYIGSISMAFIDRMFVSTLDAGMISVLAYAGMIALLPMEVFGQAVLTAFYPSLSRDHAAGDGARLRETHLRGMRLLLFVMVPTTAALVLLAQPVVTLLLERGAFSAEAGRLTAITLAALALGLPGRAVNYFNFRVFHACKAPWAAVFIGLFGVGLNTLLDWILIRYFGIVGIAVATSISLTTCALLSTAMLQRRLQTGIFHPLAGHFGKLMLMTTAFVATTLLSAHLVAPLEAGNAQWQVMLMQMAALIPGALVFLVAGMLLGIGEMRMLRVLLRRSLRRRRPA